ncbi:MAG TPA: hypothetical protein VIS76_04855 [Pseudomonadales bacterium]
MSGVDPTSRIAMGESHPRPVPEEQKQRARELDVHFSEDISAQALEALIAARCRELDPPPDWLRQVAEQMGLGGRHSTRRELFHLIEAELMINGREVELLVWFLYGVSRHMAGATWDGPDSSGISITVMEKLARRLAREPWVMQSLKRYLPGTLYRFGSIYGSTDTLAFKVAARALAQRSPVAAGKKPSGR